MSYAESLFEDNEGNYLYDDCGNPRCSEEEIDTLLRNNVSNLFKDWKEYSISENELD